jgi:hypothetical protein
LGPNDSRGGAGVGANSDGIGAATGACSVVGAVSALIAAAAATGGGMLARADAMRGIACEPSPRSGGGCETSPRRRVGSSFVRPSGGAGSRRCAAGPGEMAWFSARRAASTANGVAAFVGAVGVGGPGGAITAAIGADGGAGARRSSTGRGRVVVADIAGIAGADACAAIGADAGPGCAGICIDVDPGSGSGGGTVCPDFRCTGAGATAWRCGSWIPVGGALRARRGGSGGNRRPHAWHAASSSAFSALQNGQNLIASGDQSVSPIAR